jgi:hypothetical protein
MCGAMKNDAFELPDWSLDQALLWVATRDPDWVISGILGSNFGYGLQKVKMTRGQSSFQDHLLATLSMT